MERSKMYSIARIGVRIAGGATPGALGRIPGFREFEIEDTRATGATPDFEILTGGDEAAAPPSGVRPLYRFTAGGVDHSFAAFDEGWLFEMRDYHGSPAVTVAYHPRTGRAAMSDCRDGAFLKMATWVAFSLFAASRATLPLHASAVVREGRAVLFLGESGTGKSTHTGLWMRHIDDTWLLNDDSPIVRAGEDGIFACGSPWSGKTHCYRPEAVPLAAIVRLRQGRRNRIGRVNGPRAIGTLWPSCPPLLACDGELSAMMLGTVGRLVAAVPIYEMDCRPDREAAIVAYETIFNAR